MSDEHEDDETWQGMVAWCAGHGMKLDTLHVRVGSGQYGRGLVATKDMAPGETLLEVPFSTMLNKRSLAELLPSALVSQLTATQLCSLYIARWLQSKDSSDPFAPFLRSLPTAFPTTPLSWSLSAATPGELRKVYDLGDDSRLPSKTHLRLLEPERASTLLRGMVRELRHSADDVERRFKADWRTCRAAHAAIAQDKLSLQDFFLGWMNVNTRCLHRDLGLDSEDNLTMAPMLDFINFTPGRCTKPQHTPTSMSFSAPPSGSIEPALRAGDEVFFTYGPHDDALLLAEYGFCLPVSTSGECDNIYNSLSLDQEIEAAFRANGEKGQAKRELLEEYGYWGEMTLQAHPPPASSSWRVLVALRMLHTRTGQHTDAELALWQDMCAGEREEISDENERLVCDSLREMCLDRRRELEGRVQELEHVAKDWRGSGANATELQSLRMISDIAEGFLTATRQALEELERQSKELK